MTPSDSHLTSQLHVSQKCFWFAASISLLLGTAVFSWQIFRGHNASVELLGMKFTTEQATQSVLATKDQLLTIRTRLEDATESGDIPTIQHILPDIDSLLRTLGVAEAALKRQEANPLLRDTGTGFDTFTGTGVDVYEKISPTPKPKKK